MILRQGGSFPDTVFIVLVRVFTGHLLLLLFFTLLRMFIFLSHFPIEYAPFFPLMFYVCFLCQFSSNEGAQIKYFATSKLLEGFLFVKHLRLIFKI